MQSVVPTPIKFDPELKKALKDFAEKKEFGNLSLVVKKAVVKYIRYNPKKDQTA